MWVPDGAKRAHAKSNYEGGIMYQTAVCIGKGIPEITEEIGNSDGVLPPQINDIPQEYRIATMRMKYRGGGQCPSCGASSEVIDIQYCESLKMPVRRQQCKTCGKRWNTVGVRLKENWND